jgi:hypothetical protein
MATHVELIPAAERAGVEIGEQVRIAGKRGSYRVVGFRPGGVQLMDGDQKWHVVRPEAVRPLQPPPRGRAGRTRSAGS